ncbi:MAG: hypothetical protein HXY34_06035 [Candidatus Thorarchaeota archaeon]|nr:hypothetical protein [Candidatus Thorarchaeota archaeon]
MSKKKPVASKKAKPSLSPALFKTTGASVPIKVDDKKKRTFYFDAKITPEKAKNLAAKDGAEILGVSPDKVSVGAPSLKYDFYCVYDATMTVKFLRVRHQEISVNEEVAGVAVGGSVLTPKKASDMPGKSVEIEIVELFEITRKDSMVLDGTTGSPARSLETLIKGAGKKPATAAWISKASVSPGKLNSVDNVVKELRSVAKAPKEAKRVVEHILQFTQLDGVYLPVYYVKVSAGQAFKVMRVNAVNGAVALKV